MSANESKQALPIKDADNRANSTATSSAAEASSAASSSGAGPAGNTLQQIIGGMQQMQLTNKKASKDRYHFWETQPVAQFNESPSTSGPEGPIDSIKSVQEIRKEPYGLPDSFEWCTCSMTDPEGIKEVYELLSNHYVEDDDNMFRFNYSPEFLRWALQPPGHRSDWHLGVRVTKTRKLVGFISAIPAAIHVNSRQARMVEINFLCVHKKLRSKRLAPVLIKEITRRVNLQDIWQAAYTAGVVIPKPVSQARYYHRSLQPKKLVDIGFSRISARMTMARTIKLYKLPETTATPGLRSMQAADVPQVTQLLNGYLTRYKLRQVFTEAEISHWLSPQTDVIESFVVESPAGSGRITDLVSFYNLPSSVLNHPAHKLLKAAYMFYTVPGSVPLAALMTDALVLARELGYDVFNALDILENKTFLTDLKFGIGDGQLNYYLYNWRVSQTMEPAEIGLVLL